MINEQLKKVNGNAYARFLRPQTAEIEKWSILNFGHKKLNHVKFLPTNVICKLYVIVIFKKSKSSFNLKRILITKQLTGGVTPFPLYHVADHHGMEVKKGEKKFLYVLQTVICILYSTWSYVAKRITKGG